MAPTARRLDGHDLGSQPTELLGTYLILGDILRLNRDQVVAASPRPEPTPSAPAAGDPGEMEVAPGHPTRE